MTTMRIAVLCSPGSWYLRDLARAAAGQHDLVPLRHSQLSAETRSGSFRVTCDDHVLNEFDAVLVRTMPPGSLEQVVFRMDALAQLEADGTLVVNPPKAIEAAVDKYLALAKLQAAGVPVPRTIACQTADEAMVAFDRLGERAVVKPLFGGEGRGIAKLDDEAMAVRAFKLLEQLGAVIYLQEYIEHPGYDTRVLLVGDRAFGMRRRSTDDWRTNISRGGRGEAIELDETTIELARQSAEAVGAPLAGVDIIETPDGEQIVLEVNAVPGWKRLAKTLDVDVAAVVLHFATQQFVLTEA